MGKTLIRIVELLLLLAVAAFLWLFMPRTTPEAVRQELAQITGARVSLESAERLWFGPGVRLQGLTLEGEGYRFLADRVEVRFALLPLLAGKAYPRSLELSDARLLLTGEAAAGAALAGLPLDASWSVTRLAVLGHVGEESRELFYVANAELNWVRSDVAWLSLEGGPDETTPVRLKLTGEVSSLVPGAFPGGKLEFQFADFPAQPLVGFFTGDKRAMREARLEGKVSIETTPQQGTATGRLVAAAAAHRIFETEFRLGGTREELRLDSAQGVLAGNDFDARGAIKGWLTPERELDIRLRLPQAELRADTLGILHDALGREALGFAENLRGSFSATLRFHPQLGQTPLTGEVELEGMTYAQENLPPLEDLRGRLRLEATRVVFDGVTGRLLDTPARLFGEVRGMQVALQLDTDAIPLEKLPWLEDASVPIENLGGRTRVRARIGRDALAPTVSGTAQLIEAGFGFRGVEVGELEGQIEFDRVGARASALRGRAGGCNFELAAAARFAHWRDSMSATLRVPACELNELAKLAEQAGMLKPGLLEPETLAGPGRVILELDGKAWRGELSTDDARWSPAWIRQPFEEGSLRARFSPDGMELRQARARFGASQFSATGIFPLGGGNGRPWRVEVETRLSAEDALAFLPEKWHRWVVLPEPLEGYAVVTGQEAPGVAVEARLHSAPAAVEVAGAPTSRPSAVGHQLYARGTISGDHFTLSELSARVGEAKLNARGRIPLRAEEEFALHLTAPDATPLPDLLSLVRIPEILGTVEGEVDADVRLRGTWAQPRWSGGIELHSVRLPRLLTEPVQLRGPIEVSPEGVELKELEVVQPHGVFNIAGHLRREGLSELELTGAWANLDRLLSQVPAGRWVHPGGEWLERHPARVHIALEEIQFHGARFKQVKGELRQEDGRFQLFLPRLAYGEGRGDFFAETYPERNELLLRLNMDQIATETFLSEWMRLEPAVTGALSFDAELTGPLGDQDEFLRGASGELNFKIPRGRLERGTLPERLFAVAVLLNEGLYGFGLNRLARVVKPRGLRRFRDWTGRVELESGKAQIVESTLYARVYDVTLTGEVDLPTGAFQVHGEGNFHPGWEFDISLRAIVSLFAHALRFARGKRTTPFEFDVAGDIRGAKRVQNFRFK